jgi:N-acyl-D-aspartate/D-glutamate deacylase
MGTTTVTLGNDGSSPENLSDWMQKVKAAGTEVNIGLFVGHGTIRMASGIKYDSLPSPTQLEKMGALLREQLDAGAWVCLPAWSICLASTHLHTSWNTWPK